MSMINIGNPRRLSNLSDIQGADVQPNAVDVRLAEVHRILNNTFTLSEEKKLHRGSQPILTNHLDWWFLEPGAYEVVMKGEVDIAPGHAGFIITRSTLVRNGVFLTGGLYDSGYKGVMAAVMNVTCGDFVVRRGTRVGQFLLFQAEALGLYDGSYGVDSEHDKKYNKEQ